MTTSKDKNAEFANLFALFEKIATRRSLGSEADALDDFVPKDLEPVVRNLVSLVDSHPVSVKGRARRNTIAAPTAATTTQHTQFPLGSDTSYRFTFKMMLHKLYEVEDWGKKVQDVLDQSKKAYKSLEETEAEKALVVKSKTQSPKSGNAEMRVRFEETTKPRGRRTSIAGRTRSHTITGTGKPPASRPILTFSPIMPESDVRVVKKRCVGRRPSTVGEDKHWVYASAVSSVEVEQARHSKKYEGLQEEGEPRGAKTLASRRRVFSMGGEPGMPSARPARKRRSVSSAQVSGLEDV